MMLNSLKTAAWFATRPAFWPHFAAQLKSKAASLVSGPLPDELDAATKWAASQAQPIETALAALGFETTEIPTLPADLLADAAKLAEASPVVMGGPGDVDLLHAATSLLGARRIVETGVAYGWSTLALLAAIEKIPGARLVSVDMPYPRRNNEPYVGIVVPQRLRVNWSLIREPDRNGLLKALAAFDGEIDMCHYDSDKSRAGRRFGYTALWAALRSHGLLISDDIQDNLMFRDFASEMGAPIAVVEFDGKFVGMIRKP